VPDYSVFHEPGHSLALPYSLDGVIDLHEIDFPTITILTGKDANTYLPPVNMVLTVRSDCMIYGLAPDRWLAVYSNASGDIDEFTSSTVFAADHSDAWAALRMSGSRAADVLQCLCSVDIHPSSFGHGACFQSRLGANPALVSRSLGTSSLDSFNILVPRSSARAALEDIHDVATRL